MSLSESFIQIALFSKKLLARFSEKYDLTHQQVVLLHNIPTLDGIYNWAGIQVDGVSSTKAGEWDERLAMPDYVTESIQASINNTYDKFITKVAENRGMPFKEILSIAGGRIWSGEKALQLGLVDKIGDLNNAIDAAADYANIDQFETISYSKEIDPFEEFIIDLLKNLDVKINISKQGKIILNAFTENYNFIDINKDFNVASYCFECEYLISK